MASTVAQLDLSKLGSTFVNRKGETLSRTDILNGIEYIFIYFSALWCGPCKSFTPELAKFYEAHSTTKNFEIIFASSDRDEDGFNEYLKEMPWFAIPFALREIKYTLSAHFQVEGIPTLILLDRFGNLISDSARSNVYTDPEAKSFPWTTSAALTDSTASTLTESDIQVNRSPATDTQTTVPSSTRTPASATTTAPTPATTTAPTPASVSTPAPTSTSVKKDVQEEEASEYEDAASPERKSQAKDKTKEKSSPAFEETYQRMMKNYTTYQERMKQKKEALEKKELSEMRSVPETCSNYTSNIPIVERLYKAEERKQKRMQTLRDKKQAEIEKTLQSKPAITDSSAPRNPQAMIQSWHDWADRHKKWIVHQQERNDAAALVGITHTFDMDAHSVEIVQHKRPHEPVEKILAAAQTKYEEHKTLLETKYQTVPHVEVDVRSKRLRRKGNIHERLYRCGMASTARKSEVMSTRWDEMFAKSLPTPATLSSRKFKTSSTSTTCNATTNLIENSM